MKLPTLSKVVLPLFFLAMAHVTQAQLNTTLVGQLAYGPDLSDIWGYADASGEYALVGLYTATSIVDLSNPASPVEIHRVTGANSIWRDIKTWGHYAYVTNETGGGLQIIDLSGLPGTVSSSNWTGGPSPAGGSISFSTAHNFFVDENGVGYVIGANFGAGGAIMIDLAANPTNPPILGVYNANYVHDLYVRGDTMYAGEINVGRLSIVDVSNKLSPVILATQSTPKNFTHNTALSPDGSTVFTTDETNGAPVAAYDISDLSDINELDRYYSSTSGAIPHNVFTIGSFIVNSHYRDGVTIADVADPSNIIEVGNYDTSPFSGNGYNGCWGVYPYLPSGLVLASDIEQGLFVLDVNYIAAARLTGVVRDSVSGSPIFNANVQIVGSSSSSITNLFGQYKTGIATPGSYNLVVSASGYTSRTISISLASGTTDLDIDLVPFTGTADCSGYCTSRGNNTSDEWIQAVSIGPIANVSGDNNGYQNFSGVFSGSFAKGGTYSVTLSPGHSGLAYDEYWTIWIDVNGDGDYDDTGEKVFDSGTATNAVETGFITIPFGAATGSTGMRVQMKFFSGANRCEIFTYGEVEDYCIDITPGTGPGPCDPPANPVVVNVTSNGVSVSWDPVAGALSYQAEGRKAGTTTFRSKTTATNSLVVNSLKPSTAYEWHVRVQCSDGSFSAFTSLGSFTTLAPRILAEEVSLYPNPAGDLVYLRGFSGSGVYQLTDLQGRHIAQGRVNADQASLDLSQVIPGMYLVHWKTETASGTVSFIRQ
jgi:choice-of-anchor B domain-containing protein